MGKAENTSVKENVVGSKASPFCNLSSSLVFLIFIILHNFCTLFALLELQKHRYEDHLEGYQLGGQRGGMGEKVQGIRSIIGRYRIDRGMLRIVWEIEKPKNSYA